MSPKAPEQYLTVFLAKRDAVTKEDLRTAGSRAIVRRFFRSCLREKSNAWYVYRYCNLDIERDLLDKLEAYQPVDKHDPYTRDVQIHDLKFLRRYAFQRYAFPMAAEISRRLRELDQGWWWLFKDRLLLRIPLALMVGYGLVLGGFAQWLVVLGANPWFALGLSVVCLTASWFLIYCNVRDRIGGRREASGRAWRVFAVSLIWSGLFLLGGYGLSKLDVASKNWFVLGVAISLASSSLVGAITVQFFFARSGSIADPL